MSLIKRKTSKLIKTAAICERWGISEKTLRRIAKEEQMRFAQPGGGKTSPKMFALADVERVEQKRFGGLL
jgi:hypothetical protein